jgi:anaerobic dimethyl sulfoxide reductase subunit A
MISGTNTMYHLIKAKENGARIIAVDPRYHDTAATVAQEWIPIRPGTDTAMMIAMTNVMIKEGLQDQAFLDKYTVGFDRFKAYVLGRRTGRKPAGRPRSRRSRSTIERLAVNMPPSRRPWWTAGAAGRHGRTAHCDAITL